MAIPFTLPDHWIRYDPGRIAQELVEAKAAVMALRQIPYQRDWVESLQQMELKREVAGTTRIEGADFTDREFNAALSEPSGSGLTRSQRQIQAAMRCYRWIAAIPLDRPLDLDFLRDIHRRIVTGADDDHCPPGEFRTEGHNVTFGSPRHAGVTGGEPCRRAVEALIRSVQRDYRGHDPLIQAHAAHYHIGAMHPFLDGNGRTARAVEALLLQRAGLRDTCFIAMSNYYHDEKPGYLAALAETRSKNHDLTPFLRFALKGVAIQAGRLLEEIRLQVAKVLFRDVMWELRSRLRSPRKRVLLDRQVRILSRLLERGAVLFQDLYRDAISIYAPLKNPGKALLRDLGGLLHLRAIRMYESPDGSLIEVRREWPTEITQTELYRLFKQLPKAKSVRLSH